ncbi:heavy-metal-associated domain-containing protein [Brevibacterium sp.]|uniref:heavy-metal-associated domain-containing protein n=1 Tax=Brevibacterium sp. TaxID=1701 RepID=UPI0025B9CE92|nr:heavy-metal-associated domain-containing protein [Brevibacterium sp.]
MTTTQLTVHGMTCGHCVSSVKEEIGEVPGVTDVEVELVAGGDSPVTVTSEGPLSDDALREAVAEAGYSLA